MEYLTNLVDQARFILTGMSPEGWFLILVLAGIATLFHYGNRHILISKAIPFLKENGFQPTESPTVLFNPELEVGARFGSAIPKSPDSYLPNSTMIFLILSINNPTGQSLSDSDLEGRLSFHMMERVKRATGWIKTLRITSSNLEVRVPLDFKDGKNLQTENKESLHMGLNLLRELSKELEKSGKK